jgi:hypothetical protein
MINERQERNHFHLGFPYGHDVVADRIEKPAVMRNHYKALL